MRNGKLIADFTRGAKWIAIAPPDRVFLGNVAGHPVSTVLRTHLIDLSAT